MIKKVLYQNRFGELLASEFQPVLCDGGSIKDHCSTRYINISGSDNSSTLPELYSRKELCCGCSACYAVCPKSNHCSDDFIKYKFLKYSDRIEEFPYSGAISMLPDEEGFIYPVVDASVCIRCYRCLAVCPFGDK